MEYQVDTYVVFMEKSEYLLKNNGYLGFIVPSTWLTMHYFKNIRNFLIKSNNFEKVILFKYMVFEDVTAETCILTFRKNKTRKDNKIEISALSKPSEMHNIDFQIVNQDFWEKNYKIGFNVLYNQEKLNLVKKFIINPFCLKK